MSETTMRAAVAERFGAPEVLAIRELPIPRPGPGQLLVRVHAAGVNPVDASNRADGAWAGLEAPFVVGSDASGVVQAVGDGVTGFAPGDAVFSFSPFLGNRAGSCAEYQAIDAAFAAAKPARLSHSQAAAIPLAAGTAYELVVRRLALAPGERVLILGAAGGVGGFAVQLAKRARAVVLGVASHANHDYLR